MRGAPREQPLGQPWLRQFPPTVIAVEDSSMEVQRDFNHFNTPVTKEYLWTLFRWRNIERFNAIWLGRGGISLHLIHTGVFFSTDEPYKNDKIMNVYSKEKLVTIALIFHYVSKPTLRVVSSHYLPR